MICLGMSIDKTEWIGCWRNWVKGRNLEDVTSFHELSWHSLPILNQGWKEGGWALWKLPVFFMKSWILTKFSIFSEWAPKIRSASMKLNCLSAPLVGPAFHCHRHPTKLLNWILTVHSRQNWYNEHLQTRGKLKLNSSKLLSN